MITSDEDTVSKSVRSLTDPVEEQERLVVQRCPEKTLIGHVFRLDADEIIVGRGSLANISIDDENISRRHFRATREGETYAVMDLASRNGTYLNDARLTEKSLLREGDRIRVGMQTELLYTRAAIQEDSGVYLREALVAAKVATWKLDFASGLVTWSPQMDEMLGLPAGVLSARPERLLDRVHPEDRAAVQAFLERIDGTSTAEVEFRIEVAPNPARWFLVRGGALLQQVLGAKALIRGTAVDVTERKVAELELQRYAQTFDALFDGIVTTEPTGRIVDWNTRAEQMFGWTRQEALGKSFASLLLSPQSSSFATEMFEALQRQNRWSSELQLNRKSGEAVPCEVVATCLRDFKGGTLGYLVAHRDLSERTQLQARLLLADRLAAVGTLAAGVAHEINNPLTFINTNLRFVEEEIAQIAGEDSARTKDILLALRDALDGTDRIAHIVGDLKTFSRDPQEQALVPTELERVVRLACRITDSIVRHRANLVFDLEAVPPVKASESRVLQVVVNLIINAAQAIPEGNVARNEIRLGLRRPAPDDVCLSVADTGEGMSPEVMSHIFDPFFTTKPLGEGTGLGLSVCHSIITSMDGRIEVHSQKGKGSRFEVHLRPSAASVDPKAPAPVPEERGPEPQLRVLVLDDDPSICRALTRQLKQYDVTCVETVEAGLALVRGGPPFDAILCDVMMPGATGNQMHAELMRSAPAQAARMVFMTGGTFGDSPNVAALAGLGRPVLAKPFTYEELHAALLSAANQGGTSTARKGTL